MDEKKKVSPLYRFIKFLVRVFYPRTEVVGAENLPDEPSIIVGNHTQMNGPIISELYLPGKHYTWCAGQMMELCEVPSYAYQDFWSGKPSYIRWFYKLLSYIIAPLSVCIFNNAETIPVWHDTRIITTFRETTRRLTEGASIVIFPEKAEPYNHILCSFQDKFIDVARFYYKKTGQELSFVPLYNAPTLKSAYLGAPIRFRGDASMTEERERIRDYLMSEITRMAEELPVHTVVPYLNLPKREYLQSRPREESDT